MTLRWCYKVMGEVVGPLTTAELREQVRTGRITIDTELRREDLPNWTRAGRVRGLFDSDTTPPSVPSVDAQSPEPPCPPGESELTSSTTARQGGPPSNAQAASFEEVRLTTSPQVPPPIRTEAQVVPFRPRGPTAHEDQATLSTQVRQNRPFGECFLWWALSVAASLFLVHGIAWLFIGVSTYTSMSQDLSARRELYSALDDLDSSTANLLGRFKDDNAVGATANATEQLIRDLRQTRMAMELASAESQVFGPVALGAGLTMSSFLLTVLCVNAAVNVSRGIQLRSAQHT